MKEQEIDFLEKSILTLAKDNSVIEIELIVDYLDYVNKVKYEIREIIPILEKLVKEQKLIFVSNNVYSFSKKLPME